jgi:hypothetical protein
VHDEAHLGYVPRHYGRHPEDPTHYHLTIDSTAMDLEDVVDLVGTQERRTTRASRWSPTENTRHSALTTGGPNAGWLWLHGAANSGGPCGPRPSPARCSTAESVNARTGM